MKQRKPRKVRAVKGGANGTRKGSVGRGTQTMVGQNRKPRRRKR